MHLLFHKELYPAIPPACSSCCQVSKSWNKTPSHCRLNCIYSLSRHKERCQALKTHLWADTQKLTTPTKDSEYRGGNSQSQSIMAIVYCLSSERTARVQSTLIVLIGELKVYCNFNPGNVKDQIFLCVSSPKLGQLALLCRLFALFMQQGTSQSFTLQNACLWKDLVFQCRSSGLVSVWDHYLKPRQSQCSDNELSLSEGCFPVSWFLLWIAIVLWWPKYFYT